MKPTRLFFLAVFLHPTFQDAHGETIAEGGKATCAVVVAPDAAPAVNYAARELANHLHKVTGDHIRIVHERQADAGNYDCAAA